MSSRMLFLTYIPRLTEVSILPDNLIPFISKEQLPRARHGNCTMPQYLLRRISNIAKLSNVLSTIFFKTAFVFAMFV